MIMRQSLQTWAVFLTVVLAARHSIADGPEADVKPLTAAECELLIEQLVNPSKPPFTQSYVLKLPKGISQSDLYQKQKPIASAYNKLSANIEVALPFLAGRLADERFSYVYEDGISGVYCCMTVGGVCRRIIDAHVNVYQKALTKYDADGRSKSLWFIDDECGGIEKWWKDRQGRTLAELQLEEIEWAVRQPKPKYFSSGKWETMKKALDRMAEQIRTSGKPIQVSHKVQFFSR